MKPVILHVPEPCNEDWNKMLPGDKGRHCDKCAKQVIDFSLMSDRQVLEFFKHTKSGTCGMFRNDQLQRVITEPVKPVKKKLWGLLFSFLIPISFIDKARAQVGKVKIENRAAVKKDLGIHILKNKMPVKKVLKADAKAEKVRPDITRTMGFMITIPPHPQKKHPIAQEYIFKGTITGEDGADLPGTTIFASDQIVVTDSDGSFVIKTGKLIKTKIIVSSIGYERKEAEIYSDSNNVIRLLPVTKFLGEIVVVSYPRIGKVIMGDVMMSDCKKPGVRDTIRKQAKLISSFFAKSPASFKVFPNPAKPGMEVNINFSVQGDYTLRLFDGYSRLLQTMQIDLKTGQQVKFPLPANIPAGVYYLSAMSKDPELMQTQKIIIQ